MPRAHVASAPQHGSGPTPPTNPLIHHSTRCRCILVGHEHPPAAARRHRVPGCPGRSMLSTMPVACCLIGSSGGDAKGPTLCPPLGPNAQLQFRLVCQAFDPVIRCRNMIKWSSRSCSHAGPTSGSVAFSCRKLCSHATRSFTRSTSLDLWLTLPDIARKSLCPQNSTRVRTNEL